MGARVWNEGQRYAIEHTENNMLVSASAGSGKTAVMIERVKRLVIDRRVPVRRILMLAFNNSIAAEMKERLSKTLIDALREEGADAPFIREQIDDIGIADIMTIDGFCNSIVKNYFERAEVDPTYGIADETEKRALVNKAVNRVFEERYAEKDAVFVALRDRLGGDEELKSAVVELMDFDSAQLGDWIGELAAVNYTVPYDEAPAVRAFYAGTKVKYRKFAEKAHELYELALSCGDVKRSESLMATRDICASIAAAVSVEEMYRLIGRADIPKRTPSKKFPELAEEHAALKGAIKKSLDRLQKATVIPYEEAVRRHESDSAAVKKLVELVTLAEKVYGKEKKDANKLDFADLERRAVKALSFDDVRREMSARYDHICIDEYQDTNAVQEKILSSLSNGGNLFMVGDSKQSIYGFRFTEPAIFLGKYEGFKNSPEAGRAVDLNTNYRSDGRVLDAVNRIFDRIMTKECGGIDYVKHSRLNAGADYPDDGDAAVSIDLFLPPEKEEKFSPEGIYGVKEAVANTDDRATARSEGLYIASKIKELLCSRIYDNKTGEYRYVTYNDIVLLVSSRSKRATAVIDAVERMGIPVASAGVKTKETSNEAALLITMLRYLVNGRQDLPTYTAMKAFFGFTHGELAAIRASEVGSKDRVKYFHEAVRRYAEAYDDALARKIGEFYRKTSILAMKARYMNVYDLLKEICADTDFDVRVTAMKDGAERASKMKLFIDSVKNKSYSSSAQEFLYAYDDLDVREDIATEGELCGEYVRTSTIHRSKGLEYPIVFLIDASNRFNRRDTAKRYLADKDHGIAIKSFDDRKRMYDNGIPFEFIADKKKFAELEERMRLFYVALTRAENKLLITGEGAADFGTKEREVNSFADWINNVALYDAEIFGITTLRECESTDETAEGETSVVYRPADPERKAEYEDYFSYRYPYKEEVSLPTKYSVSALNRLEEEEGEFIPVLFGEEKTDEGTAYHKLLQYIDYGAVTTEDVDAEMSRLAESGIMSEEELRYIDRTDVLKFLNSAIISRTRESRHIREKKFIMYVPVNEVGDSPSFDKVVVQGTVDLLILGERNILVDFKRTAAGAEKIKRTYAKQLSIYKYAMEEAYGVKIDECLIYVIGRDETIAM